MFNKKNLFFLSILLIAACKKDSIDIPVEPNISIVSISPSTAHQYSDPVTITIHYEDGDGDLGENNDLVKNCFVTDNRIGITYKYRIKQLAPSGSSIAIDGNVNIEIGGQAITDSSLQQSVTYSVYVVDRAGHQSNEVTTNGITIIK